MRTMAPLSPASEHDGSEKAAVLQHRFDEAQNAGLSDLEAAEFSISETDVGLLRRLVRDGCDPSLIYRIVR